MSRQWRVGRRSLRDKPQPRWAWGVLALLVLGGLGWLYGGRLWHLTRLSAEAEALHREETDLLRTRAELRDRLEVAEDPEVVERSARRVLGWGYEDEELVILLED